MEAGQPRAQAGEERQQGGVPAEVVRGHFSRYTQGYPCIYISKYLWLQFLRGVSSPVKWNSCNVMGLTLNTPDTGLEDGGKSWLESGGSFGIKEVYCYNSPSEP